MGGSFGVTELCHDGDYGEKDVIGREATANGTTGRYVLLSDCARE